MCLLRQGSVREEKGVSFTKCPFDMIFFFLERKATFLFLFQRRTVRYSEFLYPEANPTLLGNSLEGKYRVQLMTVGFSIPSATLLSVRERKATTTEVWE